jgi:hypothetical protein
MNITKEWLKDQGACSEGMRWWSKNMTARPSIKTSIDKLIKANKLDWASWLIVRCLSHNNQIHYAIFSAEQVIEIFEKKYPKDDKPRKAIEAAKAYLKDKSEEKRLEVRAAAYVAYAAADAAADAAAYAAAYVADAAAYVADAAADAANAAVYAASAANAAASAAAYATAMKKKIILYGLSLTKRGKRSNSEQRKEI